MGACDIHAATGYKDSGHSSSFAHKPTHFCSGQMRAGPFLLLVWHLLATVTNSRECVIHNCKSSALCLLTLVSYVALSPHHCVSLTTVSSPLCLTHHCLLPLHLTHHCLAHHCVWLTSVSLSTALEHGLQDTTISHVLYLRSEGQREVGEPSISTAQIIPTENHPSDQRGRGAQQHALDHRSSETAPNNAVCPLRPLTEKPTAHGTFSILSVIRWSAFRKLLQQEKHMVNHLWDSILQSSLEREKYFFMI